MSYNEWKPKIGDLVVMVSGWDETETMMEIVKIWKNGTAVTTEPGAKKTAKKRYWKPSRWGSSSTMYERGRTKMYIRPTEPGETADDLTARNNERENARKLEDQKRVDADTARRNKWLLENGARIDLALATPRPVHNGMCQIYIAELINRRGQPIVATFHVQPDRLLLSDRDQPRISIKLAYAEIETRRGIGNEPNNVPALASFGSTYCDGAGTPDDPDAIKWALAGHFT